MEVPALFLTANPMRCGRASLAPAHSALAFQQPHLFLSIRDPLCNHSWPGFGVRWQSEAATPLWMSADSRRNDFLQQLPTIDHQEMNLSETRGNIPVVATLALVSLLAGCAPSDIPPAASNAPVVSNTIPQTNNFNSAPEPPIEVDVDKSAEHLTRGNALLAEGKAREAAVEFQLAAKYNPDDEDVFYNLGLAQARVGDKEGAKRSYEKSLELYPDYVEAHNNLGNILVSEGKYPEAIEHFEAALKNDDQHASAHNNLGTALARQKKFASSLAHFQTAVQLQPDYPQAQFNLANALLSLGDIDEAITEYNKLLRVHPEFPMARDQLEKAKRMKNAPSPAGQK
jgi:Tfp pilus assembly protein PilF